MIHWVIIVHNGIRKVISVETANEALSTNSSIVKEQWRIDEKIDGDYIAYQYLPDGVEPTG